MVEVMEAVGSVADLSNKRIKIRKPVLENAECEDLWKEVRKYVKLVPGEPDPNMGRVHEIKEEIKNGTYLNQEIIENTAARLASRFMKPE